MPQQKINYLNNRDILKEIHKSKMSYCSFLDEEHGQYDLIICTQLDEFTEAPDDLIFKVIKDPATILEAKQNKANRIQSEQYNAAMALFKEDRTTFPAKPKQKDFAVDVDSIDDNEVVFRVMTYKHVPDAPGRKKTPKNIAETKEKVNFPPFKHYVLDSKQPLEVVRSHWMGSFSNGQFDCEFGRITNKLGTMFLKLVERYSHKANWRGYTYVDEMRGQALMNLSQVGLQFNEAKSANPFAYYTAASTNSFRRILNFEQRNQDIRDDILIQNGYLPSYSRQLAHDEEMRKLREIAEEGDALNDF